MQPSHLRKGCRESPPLEPQLSHSSKAPDLPLQAHNEQKDSNLIPIKALLNHALIDGVIYPCAARCSPMLAYIAGSSGCHVASPSTYRLYMQNAAAISTVS